MHLYTLLHNWAKSFTLVTVRKLSIMKMDDLCLNNNKLTERIALGNSLEMRKWKNTRCNLPPLFVIGEVAL